MITYRQITIDDDESLHIELAELISNLMVHLGEVPKIDHLVTSVNGALSGGVLFAAGAFDGEELVGSLGFFIGPELWDFEIKVANEAYWYVKPAYRGMIGGELLDYVEKHINVAKISFGITEPSLVRYIERKGYSPIKTILSKEL